ncbi:hypothetical protein HYALB_00013275 [Hymenoscyphus albidus]|uniref:Heterokaryon incompatibility domain-containing protein n=1 Tax=Hymenoscyphus albidus TaxID=595503 RepID=A0A9N9PXG0_9HELO|nr:hypothetical protein HYALB_00013275 [Hymenoscyphus albidus]
MPTIQYSGEVFSFQPITKKYGIRLAILHPAPSDKEAIHCSLIHTTLSECDNDIIDHYTALSYVWGSGIDENEETTFRTIFLDNKPYNITTNFHAALVNLRDSKKPFRLWADSLCINQGAGGEEEKAQQVAMMGRIYEIADHTVIYLGTPDPSIDIKDKFYPILRAGDILGKPWFRRIWVFQELVFSRDPWVQIGKQRERWDLFVGEIMDHRGLIFAELVKYPKLEDSHAKEPGKSVQIHNNLAGKITQGYNLISEMQQARKRHHAKSGSKSTLLELVTARRGLGATDPRDLVWAHVGFASDGNDGAFQADYKNKSLAEAYNSFAGRQIELNGNYHLLRHVNESGKRLSGLASWAPDLREPASTAIYRPMLNPPDAGHQVTAQGASYSGDISLVRISNPPLLAHIGHGKEYIVARSATISLHHPTVLKITRFASRLEALSEDITARPMFVEINTTDLHWQRRGMDFTKLYRDIYSAWRELIQDDNILPPRDPEEEHRIKYVFECIMYKQYQTPNPKHTIDAWLILCASENFAQISFFENRALARMSSGELALVSSSSKLGDFVVGILNTEIGPMRSGATFWSPFLFRYREDDLDQKTCDAVREKISFGGPRREFKGEESERKDSLAKLHELPVRHCEYVGPFFVTGNEFYDNSEVMSSRIAWNGFATTIFAIS